MAMTDGEKLAKKKGRTGGFILGTIATLGAALLIKEATGKNVVDGLDSCYKKAKTGIKNKISSSKTKKVEKSEKGSE